MTKQIERGRHTHVWLEPDPSSKPPQRAPRYRFTDAIGAYRPTRSRDQDPDEEQDDGLICRLIEDRDGDFVGHDSDGNALVVKRGSDGSLSVYRGNGAADEATPREQVNGYYPGGSQGDPAKATATTPTGDAAKWYSSARPEHHGAALRNLQERLTRYYTGR